MSSKFNVNVNKFIKTLVADNKKDILRDGILDCDEDQIIRHEAVNYKTDEELRKIINKSEDFKDFVSNFSLNSHFIDLALEYFPNNSECFEIIIKKHTNLLTVEHLEKLLENNIMKEKIIESQDNLPDESFYYIYEKRLIKTASPKKMGIVISHKLLGKKLDNMPDYEIMSICFLRKLTEEEVNIAVNVAMAESSDLRKKGLIEILMQTQKVPDEIVETVIKEWKYNPSDTWFNRVLENQNLDGTLDFIQEHYSLDNKQISLVINNKRTSRRILSRFYETNAERVVEAKSSRLPVLGCHLQSL